MHRRPFDGTRKCSPRLNARLLLSMRNLLYFRAFLLDDLYALFGQQYAPHQNANVRTCVSLPKTLAVAKLACFTEPTYTLLYENHATMQSPSAT